MFLSPGQRGTLSEFELAVKKRLCRGEKLGVESRALPVHALLSSLFILLFGDPHLLERPLEDRAETSLQDNQKNVTKEILTFWHLTKDQHHYILICYVCPYK